MLSLCLFFQRLPGDSGGVVGCWMVQYVCFQDLYLNAGHGGPAAAGSLPLCSALWGLCAADSLLDFKCCKYYFVILHCPYSCLLHFLTNAIKKEGISSLFLITRLSQKLTWLN